MGLSEKIPIQKERDTLAILSLPLPDDDGEKSAYQLRLALIAMLSALNGMQINLMQIESEKLHLNSEVSQTMMQLAHLNLNDVLDNIEKEKAAEAKAARAAKTAKTLNILMCIGGILLAVATGNPAMLVVAVITSVLELSGAMDKLGNEIDTLCGNDHLAAFFIKLAIVVAISVAAGGATAICQTALQTAKTVGEVAAKETITAVAENGATDGANALSNEASVALKQAVLSNGRNYSQIGFIVTNTASSSFSSMNSLSDIVIYCVEKAHPNMSEEEKQKLEEKWTLWIGLAISIISMVAAGGYGWKMGAIPSLNMGETASQWLFRLGRFAFGADLLASLGSGSAQVAQGSINISLSKIVEALQGATANQELFQQLSLFISQMSQQMGQELQGVVDQISQENQNWQVFSQGDKKLAEILAAMAM